MSYKAIYTSAWHIAETCLPAAAKQFRDLGLDKLASDDPGHLRRANLAWVGEALG